MGCSGTTMNTACPSRPCIYNIPVHRCELGAYLCLGDCLVSATCHCDSASVKQTQHAWCWCHTGIMDSSNSILVQLYMDSYSTSCCRCCHPPWPQIRRRGSKQKRSSFIMPVPLCHEHVPFDAQKCARAERLRFQLRQRHTRKGDTYPGSLACSSVPTGLPAQSMKTKNQLCSVESAEDDGDKDAWERRRSVADCALRTRPCGVGTLEINKQRMG